GSEGVWEKGVASKIALDTPSVVNSPGQIGRDLGRCRTHFTTNLLNHLQKVERPKLEALEEDLEYLRHVLPRDGEPANESTAAYRRKKDAYSAAWKDYQAHRRAIREATLLLVIDEADRLRMASLEQVRAIFDQGGMGLVLVGMPGLERRLARYPQLYSRVGFVHEFGPLSPADVRQLLREGWGPPGLVLSEDVIDAEALALLIRASGGRFRVLDRLLPQISRVREITGLEKITHEVVEAGRENVVFGMA